MADKPPGDTITITVPPGDTGGSSTPSASASTSAPSAPSTAPYRGLLLRLRLPVGLFADLLSRAAAEGWGADEFLWALSNTAQFNRLFPGAQSLLDQGMSVSQAINTWRGMSSAYENALRDAGLWGFASKKFTKENVGLAISRGIDATELVYRFSIAEQAQHSEATRQAFNQILKNRGEAQLDRVGWTQFLLGKSNAKLYDLWEAAQLIQELGPEGLKVREARKLAKALGTPGEAVDVTDALSQVRRIQATFGTQQLADSGISAADLALASLSDSLTRPKLKAKAADIVAKLEQLNRNMEGAAKAVDRTASFVRGGRPISESAPQGEYAG